MFFSKKPAPKKERFTTGGKRVYAVGDIHGMMGCLHMLMVMIDHHLRAHPVDSYEIVFLGDYVDRGSHSRDVLDYMVIMAAKPHITCLAGNHEWALLRFLQGKLPYHSWYRWGGDATMKSYGVTPCPVNAKEDQKQAIREQLANAIPETHIQFLKDLPHMHELGDYVFVHAGLRPNIPLHKQKREDVMMIREDFLGHPVTLDKCIIHGHSVFAEPHIRERSIGIDTGAYDTNRLTAIVIQDHEYSFLSTSPAGTAS